MESGGGGQMNFWPGFVDALSNMVMAMIFMMLVFMIMMFHYKLNQGVKQDAPDPVKTKQENAAPTQQRVKELEAKVTELSTALEKAQSKAAPPRAGSRSVQSVLSHPENIASTGPYANEAKQSGSQPPAVEGDGAVWTVTYAGREVKLDGGADKTLRELLSRLSQENPRPHLVLTAEASQSEGYSDSRRLAYYRALGVRNLLLQAGWISADIDIEIAVRAEPGASSRVLIRAASGKAR
ncbi:hypothetical protein [Herbaspirillum huttiense]|uniref:hypothetical protein n=1 Tax=Herbaspirillum huttiense TaxID=863372 RepID=UPI0031E1579A